MDFFDLLFGPTASALIKIFEMDYIPVINQRI